MSQNTTLHMKNPNPTKHINLDLKNVDHVSSYVRSSQFGAVLYVFEDNEALIKMIIKCRSPTMRHVSRTHRVALDWLFDRINLDPKIQIRYIDTKHQLEAEVISLVAGLRMDGIPALDLWDSVIEVFHSSPNQTDKTKDVRKPRGNLSATPQSKMRKQISTTNTNLDLTNIDHVPSNGTHSAPSAMLNVFEDNEAVIKMTIKGRSPTMRHVSRTHRVALDWLFDRINLDFKIFFKNRYIDTKHQLADISTKGNFTRDEWNNLLLLFNISHFSSLCCAQNFSLISCSQNDGEEDARTQRRGNNCGKITAHSDEPDFNCFDKFLIHEPSDCVEKPGDTQSIYRET